VIPSKHIATLIENARIASFKKDLFIGKVPDEPDACVTVIDSGGYAPDSSDVKLNYPTVQVRTRGLKGEYTSAYSKLKTIKDLLHDYTEASAESSGERIIGIWALSDILFLGYDENNRSEFTLNLRMQTTE
jgi:hypothetical protein